MSLSPDEIRQRSIMLTYGVPPADCQPLGGVWLIHKHIQTGELLGPSVPFGMQTRVTFAIVTRDGWQEIDEADARRRGYRSCNELDE
jgi:hypothetical protein